MKRTERIRELRADLPSEDELRSRGEQGWQLAAVEWQREAEPKTGGELRPAGEAVPYGLRIAEEARVLEEDPRESEALALMLALVIDDEMSFSQVAAELNERGFSTRDGRPWTQVSVFNMMPRIVETAPRVFASPDWHPRRRKSA